VFQEPARQGPQWRASRSHDLLLCLSLGVLGVTAAFISFNIPGTELYFEIRWAFGYMGFALLGRTWLAVALACILAAAGFHKVPLYVAFFGNLSFALPLGFLLRWLYRRHLQRIRLDAAFAVAWFVALLCGMLLVHTTMVFFVVALLRDAPVLATIGQGFAEQPFLVESLIASLISALGLTIYRVNASLGRQERHLATVLHSIGDAVITTDTGGRVTLMNPVAEALTGWALDEARDRPLEEVFVIVNAKTGEPVSNPVARVLESGQLVGLANHTMLISRDGGRFQIADSAAPLRAPYDVSGAVQGVVLVFRDVTGDYELRESLRASEACLRESNAILQGVVDNIPDVLGLQRPDHSIVWYNQRGYDFLGLSPEQAQGRKCWELLGRGGPCEPCATSEALRCGELRTIEKYVPELGRHLECRATPVLGPEGEVVHVIELLRDMTERMQAEERFRKIVEMSLNLVCIVDINTFQFLMVNPACREILGYTEEELVGQVFLDFVHPDDVQPTIDVVENLLRKGEKVFRFENRYRTSAGDYRWLDWVSHPAPEQGVTYAIAADITPRKQDEARLRRAMEETAAASRAKSEFLANMSHEIRTPLNGIVGMLQLLLMSGLEDQQREYATTAIKASSRLSSLLSDILDITVIESGRLKLHQGAFSLHEVMGSMESLFHMQARDMDNTLEIVLGEGIPEWLQGDEQRLRQVLFNLVGNALKFTKGGHVRAEAHLLPHRTDRSVRVLFIVQDSGIGIEEGVLEDMFEAFSQEERSYTRKYQGAGLGLPIVRRLAALMGGSVCVQSEKGAGSTFYISLPFGLHEGEAAVAAALQSGDACSGLRILVVEDDAVNRMALTLLLERLGCSVVAAEDGSKALEALAAEDMDAVLMDIQMPVLDGLSAIEAIRNNPEYRRNADIVIIALTAYAMVGDREKFLQAGADEYLAKPVDMDTLDALMARVRRMRGHEVR